MPCGRKILLVAVAAAEVSADAPVTKVVKLLEEMKGKVAKDLAGEAVIMEEYSAFCSDEVKEKGFAIETAAREIEQFSAVIQESKAKLETTAATISESGTLVSEKETELQKAEEIRATEKEDYLAAEKELVDTVDTLARAAQIVKKETSFVQVEGKHSDGFQSKWQPLASALSLIIDSARLPEDASSTAQRMQALLQQSSSSSSDDDLTLFLQQEPAGAPQATTSAYESHSGGIVATLEDMKDKSEEQLQKLQTDELKAKQAFELLAQSLHATIETTEKEIAQAKETSAIAGEALAKAEGEVKKTQAAKKADEEYTETLKHDCAAKSEEWEARQNQAASEQEALAKGIEILSQGVKVFMQTKVSTRRMKSFLATASTTVEAASAKDVSKRDSLRSFLRKLSREFDSFALMQVASAAKVDPFVKIRGLVEEMITKLEQQAQEEATHEAYCKEETAKSETAKKEKTAAVDKHQARIDEAQATLGELAIAIKDLHKELREDKAGIATAAKIRTEEAKDYEVSQADYSQSVAAVRQARTVISEYYEGEGAPTAFLQQPSFGGAQTDGAKMLIGILETSEEEFSKTLAEIETAEAEAKASFEKLTQESKVAQAAKEAELKGKESEVKSLNSSLLAYKEDYGSASKELDAVLEYSEKLKPQCEVKAMTYEEKKAKRDAEIQGLHTALEILAAE